MIFGFSGTKAGMTDFQKSVVTILLADDSKAEKFVHGDCIGSDAIAHETARAIQIPIHIFPSTLNKYRAYSIGAELIADPKPPLKRNKDIVNCCDVLLATPSGHEKLRSGTWATIRYAKSINKKIFIIYPFLYIEYFGSKTF